MRADDWQTGERSVCFVVASALTVDRLLKGQVAHHIRCGWRVALVCPVLPPELKTTLVESGCTVHEVPMVREMDPARDVRCLLQLVRVFHGERPFVVHGSTPKGALLAMLAAWITDVPVRLYLLRGLRLETLRGAKRGLVRAAERVMMWCAHDVVAVSHSLREEVMRLGLAHPDDVRVLGAGGSNGVDVGHLRPPLASEIMSARQGFGVPDGVPVVGFVGRLTRDKGLDDLKGVMERVWRDHPEARLLLVGPAEDADGLDDDFNRWTMADGRVVRTGALKQVRAAYWAMDVLAFPSRREGLPNVPLEAAACGVPTVAYAVTGCVDAVVDGDTGILNARSAGVDGFARAVCQLLRDDHLRLRLGQAARGRVMEHFGHGEVWRHHLNHLEEWVRRVPSRQLGWQGDLKRFGDVVFALALLAGCSGLFATAAVFIGVVDGLPVFFTQQRPGYLGKSFVVTKFRSMTRGPGRDGDRLKWWGRLLRGTSVDELPQLLNILKGEMSFVGPRPLLTEYMGRYNPEQIKRHLAIPGITGLTAVEGRNALCWDEKFALDLQYVRRWSLRLDMEIAVRTVAAVLSRHGVEGRSSATMEEFRGHDVH